MKKPFLCTVDKSYLLFLRNTDSRVPHKPERPFVANVIELGGYMYAIPLTSQIVPASGKPRVPFFTSFITNQHGREIGALLYNNMIPVTDRNIKWIEVISADRIDSTRYIRANEKEIAYKAEMVYKAREEGKKPLCNLICCDYKLLEKRSIDFNQTLEAKKQDSKPSKTDIKQQNMDKKSRT